MEILAILKRYCTFVLNIRLKLLSAAESLGSYFLNRHTGTFGRCGIISFNGNKIVTTGSGGAILTDDPTIASKEASTFIDDSQGSPPVEVLSR